MKPQYYLVETLYHFGVMLNGKTVRTLVLAMSRSDAELSVQEELRKNYSEIVIFECRSTETLVTDKAKAHIKSA